MKILFDHQIFEVQKYGGISRYFYELINQGVTKNIIETDVTWFFSNNYYLSNSKSIKHKGFFLNTEFKGKRTANSLINKFFAHKVLKQDKFDIFHPTYYNPYFLKHIASKPFVLTVFDMIHEKFPELFPEDDTTSANKRELAIRADKIIAISESTKNDLVDILGIDATKIEVIYLGHSMVQDNTIELDIKVPEKYILFVGVRGGYKNFNRFIVAASKLLKENNEFSVVCVGGGAFNDIEQALFETLAIKTQMLQFSLSDQQLSLFYKKATLFVFPSLYEGFGIPVLESFACECPLACSNTSSLPEIAEDGAEYFDPYSEESIYNAIKKVLDNTEHKKHLTVNGTKRLNYFSWEQTAIKTIGVYTSLIQ